MLAAYVGPNDKESWHTAKGATLSPGWHSLKKTQ